MQGAKSTNKTASRINGFSGRNWIRPAVIAGKAIKLVINKAEMNFRFLNALPISAMGTCKKWQITLMPMLD